ncbi:hypothetical protein GWA97_06505 [Flavobacterium sp. LaA7.5]|nr:hypothetical protein [Flavobacterium salilacus subsp. altitudinum]
MRTVKLPDTTLALDELDVALKYANGTYKYELESEELDIIKKIYEKYDASQAKADDDFKSILLQKATNDALQEAYNEIQIKGRLSTLRNTLLLAIDKCPYCGIVVPDELDHYLPQSIYQAISVYSRNLIPICHKCNNAKRIAINGVTKTYYNAYYQIFPKKTFFIADINFIAPSLIIDFRIDSTDLDEDLRDKLDFQFSRTKLNEKLIKEAHTFINDNKAAIEMVFEGDNDNGVKNLFLKQHKDFLNSYGINYWKTSLVYSLSNCEPFCKGGFKSYFQRPLLHHNH